MRGGGRGDKIFFEYLWVKVLSVLQRLVDRKSVSNFLTKKRPNDMSPRFKDRSKINVNETINMKTVIWGYKISMDP